MLAAIEIYHHISDISRIYPSSFDVRNASADDEDQEESEIVGKFVTLPGALQTKTKDSKANHKL